MTINNKNIKCENIPDGLYGLPRYLAVLGLSLAIGLSVIDGTVITVALPTLAREFNMRPDEAVIIVNAYQIAVAMALLPLAALGDKIGFRYISLVGLAVFIVASLGCMAASNWQTLVFWRVLQGLGSAGVMSVGSAMTRLIYPRAVLGRGISFNAMVVAIGAASAPAVGSLLLSHFHWKILFGVNIPLGIAALLVGVRYFPRNHSFSPFFDYFSAILSAMTIGSLLLLFGNKEFGLPQNLLVTIAFIAILSAPLLIIRQYNVAMPFVPFDLIGKPIIGLSLLIGFLSFCSQTVAMVIIPFFLNANTSLSLVEIGIAISAWPMTVIAIVPIAGVLADNKRAQVICELGLAISAIGLVAVGLANKETSLYDLMFRMAICGIGFGLFQSPNTRTIIAATPISRSGSVGGMISTNRVCAQTAGASIAAMLFANNGSIPFAASTIPAAILVIIAVGFVFLRMRYKDVED